MEETAGLYLKISGATYQAYKSVLHLRAGPLKVLNMRKTVCFFFWTELIRNSWGRCDVLQHPEGHVALTFPKDSEDTWRSREKSAAYACNLSLHPHSTSGKNKINSTNKRKSTFSSLQGLMDAFFFFLGPICLIDIGITLLALCCSGGEGGMSETWDSNGILQTLQRVEFLMITLHFVDSQDNVLNQAFPADRWMDWRDYMTHFFMCALLKWRRGRPLGPDFLQSKRLDCGLSIRQ